MNCKLFFILCLVCLKTGFNTHAQAPGGVSTGLTAWYKADAGVTIAGGNVATWSNQATNPLVGNMTTSSGSVTQITNNPLPFNFNNYMLYNGTNTTMQFIPTGATGTEVMPLNKGSMMGAGTSAGGLTVLNVTTAYQTSSGCAGPRCVVGLRGVTNSNFCGSTQATYNASSQLNTGGVANIFGIRGDATATVKHENTANGLRNTTTTITTRGAGQYRLSLGSFPGEFYEQTTGGNGKIAESTCYNYQLTPDEFNRLESYYAIKYGVTLGLPTAPTNYFSSASTVVWTGNTTYPYRVTVIGRDDNGALLQKQSRSVASGSRVSIYNDDLAGVFPAMNNDNTSVFATDLSFAAFADNNADTILSLCTKQGKLKRMLRTWKMQATGTIGNASIAIDATTFSTDIGSVLYSTDPNFPDATTTIAAITIVGGKKYAAIPAGNIYFTFASPELITSIDVVDLVCKQPTGGSMTLNISGGLPPFTYSWNTTPPQTGSTVSNIPTGNYTVSITQSNGCVYQDHATLTANITKLEGNLTSNDIKCAGDDNGKISINITNGTPAYQYSLNNQNNWNNSNTFNNLSGGFYTVYFKDINGCDGSDTITINEPEPLSLELKNITDDYCELGSNPNGSTEILLSGGTIPYNILLNGTPIDPSLKLTNLPKNHYTYSVTDKNGCSISDTFSIVHVPCCLVFAPNAFTPNGDGNNDVFKVETDGRVQPTMMVIYNRYGQIVYTDADLKIGWDGTMNGKPVDVGVYYYKIRYVCNSFTGPKSTEITGDLTLIR